MKPMQRRGMTDKQRRAMFAKQRARGAVVRGQKRIRGVGAAGRRRLSRQRQRRGQAPTLARRPPSAAAFETFLKEHQGLVGRAVQARVRRLGLPRGGDLEKELRQEGAIALWNAKKGFNPKKGKWSTFATRHIEGAIGRALKKQGPVTLGEREVRRRARAGKPVMELAGLSTVDRERAGSGGIARSEARLAVRSLLKGYSQRDRSIVVGVLGEGKTQSEIARRFKLSKARVNQIIGKIRKEIREKEAA